MKPLGVNVGDVMSRVTVKVELKGRRRLMFRIWLASLLFRAGAAVSGCNLEQSKFTVS